MNLNNRHHSDEDPPVPVRLADALAKIAQRRVVVPPQVDEAVLAEARRHLRNLGEPPQPQRADSFWAGIVRLVGKWIDRHVPQWHPVAPWAAVAAVLVAATFVTGVILWPGTPGLGQLAKEDLNGDGCVDVLDAFALARQLKPEGVLDSRLDLNGDGVVDQRDVEAVAAHAVSLERSGRL